MTDYTKLVKALRCCIQNPPETCVGCTYNKGNNECNVKRMIIDAADAIEALQDTVQAQDKALKECARQLAKMGPKRGEWVEENRRPRSSQFVCSECHRTAYDPQPTRDKAWRKRCRYAYCPNCGAKMEDV